MAESIDLSRSISAALAAVRQLTQGATSTDSVADDATADPPVEGVGEAADGLVRVTAVPGGQIETLWIDPRLIRLGSEALAEEIRLATNAALADLRTKLAESVAAPDTTAMMEQLQELQRFAVPQLQSFLDALTEVQERIAASGRSGR